MSKPKFKVKLERKDSQRQFYMILYELEPSIMWFKRIWRYVNLRFINLEQEKPQTVANEMIKQLFKERNAQMLIDEHEYYYDENGKEWYEDR